MRGFFQKGFYRNRKQPHSLNAYFLLELTVDSTTIGVNHWPILAIFCIFSEHTFRITTIVEKRNKIALHLVFYSAHRYQ